MFSLKNRAQKREQGFTIVELLIVIVVIGILAALVITTYSGIQAKARDSKRQTDIQALQTQIEVFYGTNNYYPSLADLNSSTWRKGNATTPGNLKGLDSAALVDPSGDQEATAPLSGSTATAAGKRYGYVATDASNAACTAAAAQCTAYTLSAYLESSKTVYTKANLD